MLNKILTVLIDVFFPKTHLQIYLKKCSQLKFESKLTSQIQTREQMFYPFYYKDPFIRDCIIELKERNSQDVARLFAKILNQWIIKKYEYVKIDIKKPIFYIVPVPQHVSKSKEKGFCHTTTLANAIQEICNKKYMYINIKVFPCILKNKNTKKLHDSQGKRVRFKLIKNTMRADITKEDAENAYFFVVDDVYTTGATFKEARRSLIDCAVLDEHIFFISIAH